MHWQHSRVIGYTASASPLLEYRGSILSLVCASRKTAASFYSLPFNLRLKERCLEWYTFPAITKERFPEDTDNYTRSVEELRETPQNHRRAFFRGGAGHNASPS